MNNILSQSISDLIDLTGKTAIVTGGGIGIGQEICFRLAEAGASVMITDINLETAKDTAKKINDSGGKAPHNILVNAIAPGVVWTHGMEVQMESMKKQYEAMGMDPEGLNQAATTQTPLGRFGNPDEIARVALFLASKLSDFMTCSIIIADGGYLT